MNGDTHDNSMSKRTKTVAHKYCDRYKSMYLKP